MHIYASSRTLASPDFSAFAGFDQNRRFIKCLRALHERGGCAIVQHNKTIHEMWLYHDEPPSGS